MNLHMNWLHRNSLSPKHTAWPPAIHPQITKAKITFYSFSQDIMTFLFLFDTQSIFYWEPSPEYSLDCHYPSSCFVSLHSTYNYITYYALLLACVYCLSLLLECMLCKIVIALSFYLWFLSFVRHVISTRCITGT